MLLRHSLRRDGYRSPSLPARLASISCRSMENGRRCHNGAAFLLSMSSYCRDLVSRATRREFRSLTTGMTVRLVMEVWRNDNFAPVPGWSAMPNHPLGGDRAHRQLPGPNVSEAPRVARDHGGRMAPPDRPNSPASEGTSL